MVDNQDRFTHRLSFQFSYFRKHETTKPNKRISSR
jgi:hypothetical protein